MTAQSAPIARLPYAVTMTVASALAVGVGYALARNASQGTLAAVIGALVFASLMSVVPLLTLFAAKDRWGLVVMGVSVARTLAALMLMMVLVEVQGFERRPTVLGILCGTAVLMVAEAVVAVWTLSHADRTAAGPSAAADKTLSDDQRGATAPRSA